MELSAHSNVQSCEDYHFEKWPTTYFQEIIDELCGCFGPCDLTQNWRVCGVCNTLRSSIWTSLLLLFYHSLKRGSWSIIKQPLEGKGVWNFQSCFILFSKFRLTTRKTTWSSLSFCGSSRNKLNGILYNHLPCVQMWSWTWGLISVTTSGSLQHECGLSWCFSLNFLIDHKDLKINMTHGLSRGKNLFSPKFSHYTLSEEWLNFRELSWYKNR